jgi:hypothetical protein
MITHSKLMALFILIKTLLVLYLATGFISKEHNVTYFKLSFENVMLVFCCCNFDAYCTKEFPASAQNGSAL